LILTNIIKKLFKNNSFIFNKHNKKKIKNKKIQNKNENNKKNSYFNEKQNNVNNLKGNDNNDNNDNNNNNNSIIYNLDNNVIHFINHKFINIIKAKKNIELKEVIQINVDPEGNCLMRCLALFIYKDENEHIRVRQEIANYIKEHRKEYENIELETEKGLKNIDYYIIYIQQINSWGGELEKYTSEEIYNINIADFRLVPNNSDYHCTTNLFII